MEIKKTMRKLLINLLMWGMIIYLLPLTAMAQTGYVSDMLLLTFRQGPSNSFSVVKTLQSNTPVSILEEKNGFYKVKLQSKEIGWVDKKFIVFDLPKTYVIDQLKREKKALLKKISEAESTTDTLNNKINSQFSQASQTIGSLKISLKKALDEKTILENSLSQVKEKYNTLIEQSKNIQKTVKENTNLLKSNETLNKDLKILKEQNQNLFKASMIKWFLSGAVVLILGWIIGQSVSTKRGRSGSSLLD
jgi:SH3 domain protein